MNINPDTGVRFGTIYLNSLDSDTADWLWTNGTNVSEEQAIKEIELVERERIDQMIKDGDINEAEFDYELAFRRAVDHSLEHLQIEEPYIEGECEGVKYGISHLGGAALLWIYESPYLTTRHLCSPCVPGAVNLDSEVYEDGHTGYDVPPEWRANE